MTYFWCAKFQRWFFSKLRHHSHCDHPWSSAGGNMAHGLQCHLRAWHAFLNGSFPPSCIVNHCWPRTFQQCYLPVSNESHRCGQKCCRIWQLISGKRFHGCIGNQGRRQIIITTTDHVLKEELILWISLWQLIGRKSFNWYEFSWLFLIKYWQTWPLLAHRLYLEWYGRSRLWRHMLGDFLSVCVNLWKALQWIVIRSHDEMFPFSFECELDRRLWTLVTVA